MLPRMNSMAFVKALVAASLMALLVCCVCMPRATAFRMRFALAFRNVGHCAADKLEYPADDHWQYLFTDVSKCFERCLLRFSRSNRLSNDGPQKCFDQIGPRVPGNFGTGDFANTLDIRLLRTRKEQQRKQKPVQPSSERLWWRLQASATHRLGSSA